MSVSGQADPLFVAPGVRRVRPDDHFMVLMETDASPMQIGALVMLRRLESPGFDACEAIFAQVHARLPATPLLARLTQDPEGFDSDVWVDVRDADPALHFQREAPGEWSKAALHRRIAELSLRRLDLQRPPFVLHAFDRVEGGRCAFYLKAHHAVADGIGFQSILRSLSDASPPAAPRRQDCAPPAPETWRSLAERNFEANEAVAAAHRARRKQALEELERFNADPANRRAVTPSIEGWGPTSALRAYTTLSLPLARFAETGRRLSATINDVFLASAAGALRKALLEVGKLPATPLVANAARSYRRPEHGPFGNRIVAIHPSLATDIADPLARLRAIQASMATERKRTAWDEALLDAPDLPYGARDRRKRFAERTAGGAAVLAGNVTLSNVPGPAEALSYAGMPQLANYPAPILGSGRFLNITTRRNGDNLDFGVMSDPTKLADVEGFARLFAAALEELAAL